MYVQEIDIDAINSMQTIRDEDELDVAEMTPGIKTTIYYH